MKLQITTPCRIHATLIDMNGSVGRIDGGIGFTLSRPNWKIEFETRENHPLELHVPPEIEGNYVDLLVSDVLKKLGITSEKAGICIKVKGFIPRHVGLGSKTQLALALGDGISRIIKRDNTPFSKDRLAFFVKRGGTSGIGVTSYFNGGTIIDGGHEFGAGKEKESFLPSAASDAFPAPVLVRDELPEEWRFVVGIPVLQCGAHDSEEVNIFKANCPIPISEVQQISHMILMKMMPAIKLRRFKEICECIDFFQGIGFKRVEVSLRGKDYLQMLQAFRDMGAPCAGMSSFGPAIYTLAQNDTQASKYQAAIDEIMRPLGGTSFISPMQNSGATIKYLT